MTFPAGFPVQGAWTRTSASIDDGEPFETQLVYWIQAGPCYADLRVPFHPAADLRCFTGRSGWAADGYRWTHVLDLEPAKPEDLGEMSWEDGRLVERGWCDGLHYEEVWVRIDNGEGPFLVAESPDGQGCIVQAGGHAITVVDDRAGGGEFVACYRVRRGDEWTIAAAIGAPTQAAALPGPQDIPTAWLPAAVHA